MGHIAALSRPAIVPPLPVELWAQITDLCSYTTRVSLASVSRMHRALALPLVFGSLDFTIPRVKTAHGEPYSLIKARRLQEYLRLDDFFRYVVQGETPILHSLRRLSVRPLIKDPSLAPVDGKASSLVTFRWDSRVVPFPNSLGQALVLGAPQLRCLGVRAPVSGHDLDFSPLTKLQQVAIVLTTGVRFDTQLRSMGALLLLSNITELQIPHAVLETTLRSDPDAAIFQPTLRHLRIRLTPGTALIRTNALQSIRSLHLEGFGDAFAAFWSREPVLPELRFLTLHFAKRTSVQDETEMVAAIVTALAGLARSIERFKITDPSGNLKLGFFVFHNFRRFSNLKVFAIAAKSMAYKYVKDLADALPPTVSTVSICIGNMSEEPEVYFQLFLPVREQLRVLHIHCLTRAGNARDKQGSTSAQRADCAREAAENVLLDFTRLEAIGTHDYFFEVPRIQGVRIPGPLPLLSLRWRESIFDTTDAEWAFDSGSDVD
ncbi:hypothetical protein HWV62_3983 [Athelia sp. TMB]|nr:hypothetical protein HWV62_3983 [Athelia sp. TMB]